MELQPIQTDQAPQAVGPYSQAIRAGNLLFCSGQIPINPTTNQLELGTVEEQTLLVMKNLQAVLMAGGSSMDRVIKATIFIKNMDDFPKINEVYGSFFSGTLPARACVEVARLPKDVLVEVDAVAAI